MPRILRVTTRNAAFQQWHALLTNRAKRQRTGEFLVQGVRPVTLAVRYGWPVTTWLYPSRQPLSQWARDLLDRVPATRVEMAPELLCELGEKDAAPPELLAVVRLPADRLARIPARPDLLVMVFDRPTAPGNIGTLIRSADAFGAHGVIITGHAADPYDPKSVRASTGSIFALPVVRVAAQREVEQWVADLHRDGVPVRIVGTDEHGDVDIAEQDFTGPTLVLVGNETQGLSAGWRRACDRLVRIPITGAASSLNAASAATVVLYEAATQRSRAGATPGMPG